MIPESNSTIESESRFKVPHVYVIIFSLIVIATIATYLVPAGEYERIIDGDGREVVVEGTFTQIESSPVGFLGIFQSLHQGMVDGASIIFFIFIIGGAFGVFRATGALDGAINSISTKMNGKEIYLIPVLMIFFALGGAVFGLAEETIPYIMIITPLALMLGYDSITGAAIVLGGASAGFSAAFMNPFTVGVAQGIAELPIYSGFVPRVVFWLIFVSVSITYVMLYARKIKKDPTKSIMYEEDQKRNDNFNQDGQKITARQGIILGILILTVVVLAFGVMEYGWYITEIAGLFFLMGIIMGIVAKMHVNEIAEAFVKGCEVLVLGALVVGFAYAILVVLQDGKIMDTILHGLASAVSSLPAGLTAVGMYISQAILNFIVPSGSGQAALTMPIMAPLSDLVGVSRQTAVLAFQFGDGISNIFTPTSGYFMAGLAAAGITWTKWVRWVWPLILIQYVLGAIFITIAHLFIF
ncbi:C4-dicarboxylate ABC transporter permease [Virgibacillus profundi]|uniref:C4-dicarboxylate ABC transporter permease n=1 Tax=Virgibacillus profundi TaxID=2024555 RepID=A0A2A2IG95_9BACI|nr:YfcC family protein [Virgibacillus profundi]PAV30789.1 C4-dicarboxylate ABC transporter permease [Virgibacillus profundi]PXY54972.1 putative basic amino acid antiporter YfcC [Virgibacillus profundi]